MIKINNAKSLNGLQNEDNIKAFLLHYLNYFLEQYDVDTILSFGEIQYLENESDVENYEDTGLAEYLNKWGYEWIDEKKLSNQTIIYIFSVVTSTDYGLNIITKKDFLDISTIKLINDYKKEHTNV